MESFSPLSLSSPPQRVRELSRSEGDAPGGRVRRQQSITSSNQAPESPTKRSIASQLASPRYVKQFNALIEHQREVHSEERALWHTERQELYEKITQLETSLRQNQTVPSIQTASPINKISQGNGNSWCVPSKDRSRNTSTSEIGDEIWRPKSNVQPTRTFSDSPAQTARSDSRLPSIAEAPSSLATITSPNHPRSREPSIETTSPSHRPSIAGDTIDKNLDGINFRSSSLNIATAKSIMTPQSPSPQSPSPARSSPRPLRLPLSGLDVPNKDPYTKDAGHTPLARRTYFNTDGTSSTRSSSSTTPIQSEMERPPLEPQPTRTRLPSERSDSYFPPPPLDDDGHSPGDGDVAMNAPLGLTNDVSSDTHFLSALDSKLEAAAAATDDASGGEETSTVGGASQRKGERDEGEGIEQMESEPRLRIKRSMNFGSAFGSSRCGRGV